MSKRKFRNRALHGAGDLLPRAGKYQYNRATHGNYGAHAMTFEFLGIKFWFSYETLIAFKVPGKPCIIRKNVWGPTTGKHIYAVIGEIFYSSRLDKGRVLEQHPEQEFTILYNNMLREHFQACPVAQNFLDPIRAIHDDKGNYVGAGYLKLGEQAVPEPPPKKKDFYLHPRKPTRADKQWMRAEEQRRKAREALAQYTPEILLSHAPVFV